jgi:transcriptional regulator with XRE-family HTH domain
MVQLIGARIQQLREELDLDVSQLAYKAGIHPSTIHKIEANDRPNTSAVILGRIAEALHTSVDYLVGRTNDPAPLSNPAGASPQVRRYVAEMLDIWSELEEVAPDLLDQAVLIVTSQTQLLIAAAEADRRRREGEETSPHYDREEALGG